MPVTSAPTDGVGAAPSACPSVHAPFVELDGALVRVRLPGGVLALRSIREVAAVVARVGGGAIELTNRANVQLRGTPMESAGEVRDALVAADLAVSDPAADERRNVLMSPTAGVDAAELDDPTSLACAVVELLVADVASGLSPKFGVLVDGGGSIHVRGRSHDIAVGAVRDVDGAVRYEVRLGDALPLTHAPSESVWTTDPARVLGVIAAMIEVCRPYGRASELLNRLGETGAWNAVASIAVGALTRTRGRDLTTIGTVSASAVGVRPERSPGRVSVGAAVPLGRLNVEQLSELADIVGGVGSTSLRISPWRSVVVTGVATHDVAALVGQLEGVGLVTDPDHPANVVVACAGSRGCAAGYVDAPAHARAIIALLTECPPDQRPASVHVSGCEKGCASPARTARTIVGGPTPETYTLYTSDDGGSTTRTGAARDDVRFGTPVQSGLSVHAAIRRAAGEPPAR